MLPFSVCRAGDRGRQFQRELGARRGSLIAETSTHLLGQRLAKAQAQAQPATTTDKRFKEALDKKNAQHRKGEAHLDGDSQVHGTHGAVTKREFRRKSG